MAKRKRRKRSADRDRARERAPIEADPPAEEPSLQPLRGSEELRSLKARLARRAETSAKAARRETSTVAREGPSEPSPGSTDTRAAPAEPDTDADVDADVDADMDFEREMASHGVERRASGPERVVARPAIDPDDLHPPALLRPPSAARSDGSPPAGESPTEDEEPTDPELADLLRRVRAAGRKGRDDPARRRSGSRELLSTPLLDLHGFSVADARSELRRVLDAAAAGGVRRLRVIVGRGRHAEGLPGVREEALRLLASSTLVAEHRVARASEGGAGVVIVTLRRRPH